jgi:hypothetical protein
MSFGRNILKGGREETGKTIKEDKSKRQTKVKDKINAKRSKIM